MPVFDNLITPKKSKKRKKYDSPECGGGSKFKEFKTSTNDLSPDTITFNDSDTDLSRVLDQVENMSPRADDPEDAGTNLNTPLTKRRVISLCRESERKRIRLQDSVFGTTDRSSDPSAESNAWSQLFDSPIKLSADSPTPSSEANRSKLKMPTKKSSKTYESKFGSADKKSDKSSASSKNYETNKFDLLKTDSQTDDDFMCSDIFSEKPKPTEERIVTMFDNPPSSHKSDSSPIHVLMISEESPDKCSSLSHSDSLTFGIDSNSATSTATKTSSTAPLSYVNNNSIVLQSPANPVGFASTSPVLQLSVGRSTASKTNTSRPSPSPHRGNNIPPCVKEPSVAKDLPPDFRSPISTIENVHAANPFSTDNDTGVSHPHDSKSYQYNSSTSHWDKHQTPPASSLASNVPHTSSLLSNVSHVSSLSSNAPLTASLPHDIPHTSSLPSNAPHVNSYCSKGDLAPFSFSLTTNSSSLVTTTTPTPTNHNVTSAASYRNPFEHPPVSNSSAPSPLNLQLPNGYPPVNTAATKTPLFPPVSFANSPWMTGITAPVLNSTPAVSSHSPFQTTYNATNPVTNSIPTAYRHGDKRSTEKQSPTAPCYLNKPSLGGNTPVSQVHHDSLSSYPRETPPPHVLSGGYQTKPPTSMSGHPPSSLYLQKQSPPKIGGYVPPSQMSHPSPATTPGSNSMHGLGPPGPYFNASGLPAGGLLDKTHISAVPPPSHGSITHSTHSSLPSPHYSNPPSSLPSPHTPAHIHPSSLHALSPTHQSLHVPLAQAQTANPSMVRVAQQYMDPAVHHHGYPHTDAFPYIVSEQDRGALYKSSLQGHALSAVPSGASATSRPVSLSHPLSHIPGAEPACMSQSQLSKGHAATAPAMHQQPLLAKASSAKRASSSSSKKSRSKKRHDAIAPPGARMLQGLSEFPAPQQQLPFNPSSAQKLVSAEAPPSLQKDMRPTYLGGNYISALPPTSLCSL